MAVKLKKNKEARRKRFFDAGKTRSTAACELASQGQHHQQHHSMNVLTF